MKTFIADALSGETGASSKRVMLFIFSIVFIVVLFVNLFTKKLLDETLQNQLFYIVTTLIASLVGESIVGIWKNTSKLGE